LHSPSADENAKPTSNEQNSQHKHQQPILPYGTLLHSPLCLGKGTQSNKENGGGDAVTILKSGWTHKYDSSINEAGGMSSGGSSWKRRFVVLESTKGPYQTAAHARGAAGVGGAVAAAAAGGGLKLRYAVSEICIRHPSQYRGEIALTVGKTKVRVVPTSQYTWGGLAHLEISDERGGRMRLQFDTSEELGAWEQALKSVL